MVRHGAALGGAAATVLLPLVRMLIKCIIKWSVSVLAVECIDSLSVLSVSSDRCELLIGPYHW